MCYSSTSVDNNHGILRSLSVACSVVQDEVGVFRAVANRFAGKGDAGLEVDWPVDVVVAGSQVELQHSPPQREGYVDRS